jgi:hypothetical protein
MRLEHLEHFHGARGRAPSPVFMDALILASLTYRTKDPPWYTLRQITVITASLAATKVNPDLFLESANQALTPADGRYFEQVAEVLAA